MEKIIQAFSDLTELFFPHVCFTCDERLITQEKYICMKCWHDLPITNFHQTPDNKVAQLFWGRVNLEGAGAYFAYKKGSRYQHLIHLIKYKGLKELGFETGFRYGLDLKESSLYNRVDYLVPVPLHPKKQKKRGFNQSEWIAEGIASSLEKPVVNDNLYRKIYSETQTRKNRFERWQNMEGIFETRNPHEFLGKHILLVDDVVTTGSTLEACAYALLKIQGTKVSIVTLAYAD